MTTLIVTIFVSSALALPSRLAISEALASLAAIQPIPWQVVDQGTPATIPIHVASSFLNPFDSGDEVRLLLHPTLFYRARYHLYQILLELIEQAQLWVLD